MDRSDLPDWWEHMEDHSEETIEVAAALLGWLSTQLSEEHLIERTPNQLAAVLGIDDDDGFQMLFDCCTNESTLATLADCMEAFDEMESSLEEAGAWLRFIETIRQDKGEDVDIDDEELDDEELEEEGEDGTP